MQLWIKHYAILQLQYVSILYKTLYTIMHKYLDMFRIDKLICKLLHEFVIGLLSE